MKTEKQIKAKIKKLNDKKKKEIAHILNQENRFPKRIIDFKLCLLNKKEISQIDKQIDILKWVLKK